MGEITEITEEEIISRETQDLIESLEEYERLITEQEEQTKLLNNINNNTKNTRELYLVTAIGIFIIVGFLIIWNLTK